MTKKMDINKFNELVGQVSAVTHILKMLGITINNIGEYRYNWEGDANIKASLEKDYPFGIVFSPLSDKIAMAIAVAQEERNDYVDQSEIDYVNKFFNFEGDDVITQLDVRRLSKHI